ncbi:hypothetical protein Tco_0981071, partial [Tanacetum coccineum]
MEVKRMRVSYLRLGELRGDLLDDDIEILRRSKRFRREEPIEMETNERMVVPKGNRVKVAEKEETGKFDGSPDGGPITLKR